MNTDLQSPRRIFEEFLLAGTLKLTSQRLKILDYFLAYPGHVGTEELYDHIKRDDPRIGQATVYRTLKLLAEAGLAREVHFGDGITRYERLYGEKHHDHLICEQCGAFLEVVDERIEALQEELALRYGFTLTSHKMYLYGLCAQCRGASPA